MYNMVILENQAKKWGNSFGVLIPREIARKINLKEGQILQIEVKLKKRIDAFGKFRNAGQFREEEQGHKELW